MTTPEDATALVRRMQECFNSRQFDRADELLAPDFYSHALGATGFEAGKVAWRTVVARFPEMRVVAEDILVDRDRVAVRSSVTGIATADGEARPMLIEIFRVHGGKLAEAWEAGTGFPVAASPEDLIGHVR